MPDQVYALSVSQQECWHFHSRIQHIAPSDVPLTKFSVDAATWAPAIPITVLREIVPRGVSIVAPDIDPLKYQQAAGKFLQLVQRARQDSARSRGGH